MQKPRFNIQYVKISEVKENPDNPRIIKDDRFKKLVESIKGFPEMLEIRPVVVNDDMVALGGNQRFKACKEAGLKEIPIIKASSLTPEQQKEFMVKDNVNSGEWDLDLLEKGWSDLDLDGWGLDMPGDTSLSPNTNDKDKAEAAIKLADKFIVPPFTILDTRQGYWQERKKHWNTLIGDKGESRQKTLSKGAVTKFKPCSHTNGVSIFDPVLAELINRWFGLPECKTFDCFAGDTIFGYVSGHLKNHFTGIELRKEQVKINNARVKHLTARYICDDGQNVDMHLGPESQDLLFSCPPYFDLEVYSDLPNDASNQKDYEAFLTILKNAFTGAIRCLKQNRFAVITVGDIRNKDGFYYRFVDAIKDVFASNGMPLYNEMILLEQLGSLRLRVNKQMLFRKVGKCHQNVLVFYKGNPKEIKNIFPEIDLKSVEYESADV